jgi:hypothetical protein
MEKYSTMGFCSGADALKGLFEARREALGDSLEEGSF